MGAASFTKHDGIPSNPVAFLGLREVKYFKLLFSETNEKENEFGLITFEDQKNKKNNSIAKYITL